MQAVEDRKGLLARGGRAGDRASLAGRDTGGNRRAAAHRVHRGRAHHQDTLASMLRRGVSDATAARARPGLDRPTVNYVHTIIHRAFKDGVRWGRLARNPADAANPPHGGQKSDGIHAWDAPTLRAFLEASSRADDRLHGLWVLLATTGMRRGEALGLRWSDLDLDAARLRVVQTIIQTRSEVTIGEPKTTQGRRPIALDKGTISVMREHRRRMLEERLLIGPDFDDQGLVFHQPDGTWLHPDAVSEMFIRRVRRYGLERLTLHGLRHTWATLALEQGVHPRVVQERFGHSTISITLGMYSHVGPTLHDEPAAQISKLILA
jgi:integrase